MPVSYRIDWPHVLDDLSILLAVPVAEGSGLHLSPLATQALADALGVPRGTLRGWLDGSEPRHADGEKLLDRWRVLTGKPREFAPVERRTLSAHSR